LYPPGRRGKFLPACYTEKGRGGSKKRGPEEVRGRGIYWEDLYGEAAKKREQRGIGDLLIVSFKRGVLWGRRRGH